MSLSRAFEFVTYDAETYRQLKAWYRAQEAAHPDPWQVGPDQLRSALTACTKYQSARECKDQPQTVLSDAVIDCEWNSPGLLVEWFGSGGRGGRTDCQPVTSTWLQALNEYGTFRPYQPGDTVLFPRKSQSALTLRFNEAVRQHRGQGISGCERYRQAFCVAQMEEEIQGTPNVSSDAVFALMLDLMRLHPRFEQLVRRTSADLPNTYIQQVTAIYFILSLESWLDQEDLEPRRSRALDAMWRLARKKLPLCYRLEIIRQCRLLLELDEAGGLPEFSLPPLASRPVRPVPLPDTTTSTAASGGAVATSARGAVDQAARLSLAAKFVLVLYLASSVPGASAFWPFSSGSSVAAAAPATSRELVRLQTAEQYWVAVSYDQRALTPGQRPYSFRTSGDVLGYSPYTEWAAQIARPKDRALNKRYASAPLALILENGIRAAAMAINERFNSDFTVKRIWDHQPIPGFPEIKTGDLLVVLSTMHHWILQMGPEGLNYRYDLESNPPRLQWNRNYGLPGSDSVDIGAIAHDKSQVLASNLNDVEQFAYRNVEDYARIASSVVEEWVQDRLLAYGNLREGIVFTETVQANLFKAFIGQAFGSDMLDGIYQMIRNNQRLLRNHFPEALRNTTMEAYYKQDDRVEAPNWLQDDDVLAALHRERVSANVQTIVKVARRLNLDARMKKVFGKDWGVFITQSKTDYGLSTFSAYDAIQPDLSISGSIAEVEKLVLEACTFDLQGVPAGDRPRQERAFVEGIKELMKVQDNAKGLRDHLSLSLAESLEGLSSIIPGQDLGRQGTTYKKPSVLQQADRDDCQRWFSTIERRLPTGTVLAQERVVCDAVEADRTPSNRSLAFVGTIGLFLAMAAAASFYALCRRVWPSGSAPPPPTIPSGGPSSLVGKVQQLLRRREDDLQRYLNDQLYPNARGLYYTLNSGSWTTAMLREALIAFGSDAPEGENKPSLARRLAVRIRTEVMDATGVANFDIPIGRMRAVTNDALQDIQTELARLHALASELDEYRSSPAVRKAVQRRTSIQHGPSEFY